MSQPNFLILGAQKSGTTWLQHFIASHPDAFMSERKELQYFCNRQRFTAMSRADYLAHFRGSEGFKAIGEATASYLRCAPGLIGSFSFIEGIPERVHRALGEDLRFIVVIRNPIDRAISGLLHYARKNRIGVGELLTNAQHGPGIIHHGFYAAHLDHWTKVYPADRFHVTTFDDLFSSTDAAERIQRFIGLDPIAPPLRDKKNVGTGFTRNDDGALASSGERIATAADIQHLREIYADDVSRLRAWTNHPWKEFSPNRLSAKRAS